MKASRLEIRSPVDSSHSSLLPLPLLDGFGITLKTKPLAALQGPIIFEAAMDERANLGPLTTQWTPPASCSVPILEDACSATECTAYYGFMCSHTIGSSVGFFTSGSLSSSTVSVFTANYKMTVDTACFPPITLDLKPSYESRLNGYGYYSPGLECPSGYSKGWLLAPDGKGRRDWAPQVATAPGETVAGCCPR